MPALGGASAQPLRFMDFLIRESVRTVFLYGAGCHGAGPRPVRYAVHKLIVRPLRTHRVAQARQGHYAGRKSLSKACCRRNDLPIWRFIEARGIRGSRSRSEPHVYPTSGRYRGREPGNRRGGSPAVLRIHRSSNNPRARVGYGTPAESQCLSCANRGGARLVRRFVS
ncbi:GSU2403 family nucleotidyltransferase fold protein [Sinorhizobium terangae]|uniref:GSU2403 family nucleotidyltransferase fold protein n=1 Tax=Sinorhizobium terangae TaxID=110322 RepID=UPI003D15FC3F